VSVSNHLVERLKRKEEDAFDQVYTQYFKLIKHIAYQILPSDELANDIVQETFLKMYENIDTFTDNISFSAWLCTIAKNLALNEKKKRDRVVQLSEDISCTREEQETPAHISQQNSLLEEVKDLLGERDYSLVMMKAYHGMSYQELSELTGETVAALTNRYHRAIKKIKRNIKP